jgi:hypothetical protein
MPTTFHAPPQEALTELARKWVAVERLINDEYQTALTTDPASLSLLQRLLDEDVVSRDRYALQCLGCVLGRIMGANIPGLDWVLAEDETGADICLRYADTSLCVFPLTMISKRIERGEAVDVAGLYEQTSASVRQLANEAD